jgi:hypothetical protein
MSVSWFVRRLITLLQLLMLYTDRW